jgi:hypothetical protein
VCEYCFFADLDRCWHRFDDLAAKSHSGGASALGALVGELFGLTATRGATQRTCRRTFKLKTGWLAAQIGSSALPTLTFIRWSGSTVVTRPLVPCPYVVLQSKRCFS